MLQHQESPIRIIRRKQVEEMTGLSRSTIYLKVSKGEFPKPISLGARAVGWLANEIEEWLFRQIEHSRNARP